uniref:EF-hand domain-containing protein n=1 Tax=Alexandrium catenella TaxID=2925 RepID=A0A7S1PID9_ALECA
MTPQQQQYNMAMKQQEELKKRQQLENIKKLEEMRRLQQVQQQELQRRQLEENRKKLEEANRKRIEEQRKRMEDVKRLQEEQRAILNIRRVIQKVRMTTPELIEEHEKELEEVKTKELEACGSQKERMQQEIEQGIEQAKQRVEQIKEQQKKVEELLKEFEELVTAAETAAKTLKEEAEPFSGDKELALDEVNATAKAVDDAGQEAKDKMKACTDFILSKGQEMKSPDLPGGPASESKQTLAKLLQRINECTRGTEATLATCRDSREKAVRKAEARKKLAKLEATFDKYDGDKDGILNRNEIKKFAKGEFDFSIANIAVDTIWKVLVDDGEKGIKKESFQRLKYAIGIAREKVKDAERKAAREAREKELAKLKSESEEKIKDAEKSVDAAGELVDKAEEQANPLLTKGKTMLSADMLKLADEVAEAVKEAREEAVKAKKEAVDLADGVDKDLQVWIAAEIKKLEEKMSRYDQRLTRSSNLASRFRDEAKIKEGDELYALEKRAIDTIKNHKRVNKLSNEDMFADIDTNKDGKIDESEFIAFFKRCEKMPKADKKEEDGNAAEDEPEMSEEDLRKAFTSLDEDSEDAIAKEKFVNVIRVFMKVSKDTVITTGISIKESKTLRRLDLGEVVEILEGPTKEDTVDVLRVKAKVMKDDIEGWITLAGNQGTVFLEDGGHLFKVVKDTILTESFELDGGGSKDATRKLKDTTRKLKEGEIVEVREWARKEEKSGLMRMKCKVKSDGMTGWVTTVGNQGTLYMEVM